MPHKIWKGRLVHCTCMSTRNTTHKIWKGRLVCQQGILHTKYGKGGKYVNKEYYTQNMEREVSMSTRNTTHKIWKGRLVCQQGILHTKYGKGG